jgi:hypothetical protein
VWKRLPISDRDEFLEDLNSIEHDLMDSVKQHLPSFTIILSSGPFRSRPSTDRPSNWQFLSIRDSQKSQKFKRKSWGQSASISLGKEGVKNRRFSCCDFDVRGLIVPFRWGR